MLCLVFLVCEFVKERISYCQQVAIINQLQQSLITVNCLHFISILSSPRECTSVDNSWCRHCVDL